LACAARATDIGRGEGKTMTKLTLEDLEAVRKHYGIAHEEEDLHEDLGAGGGA
jgi:hypothetical protein